MKPYVLLSALLLGGCFQATQDDRRWHVVRETPLTVVRVRLDDDVLSITSTDSVSLVMEGNYRSYKDGQRLTIYFEKGRPYLRVEDPRR